MSTPLPILSSRIEASPTDLLRLFHRTELHWAEHMGEAESLDVGTAIINPKLANVWDANQIREAALPDGMTADKAIDLVDAHYAARGSRCWRWTMNPSTPAERVEPLRAALQHRGWVSRAETIMQLGTIALRNVPQPAGVKVIPSRASFRHARLLAAEMSRRWNEAQLVDAFECHFDDPHWDALLALRDANAVGHVGVLAVGEVGRIESVFVTEGSRRQGIGRMLVNRAIEICARSLFKHVMLSVDPDNTPAIALYQSMGFKPLGRIESLYIGELPQPNPQSR
jgi:ribosomal protein S18 acetylase RimI-like enzyme